MYNLLQERCAVQVAWEPAHMVQGVLSTDVPCTILPYGETAQCTMNIFHLGADKSHVPAPHIFATFKALNPVLRPSRSPLVSTGEAHERDSFTMHAFGCCSDAEIHSC